MGIYWVGLPFYFSNHGSLALLLPKLVIQAWFLSRGCLEIILHIHSRARRAPCPLVGHSQAVILRLGMDVGAKGLQGFVSQKMGPTASGDPGGPRPGPSKTQRSLLSAAVT